MRVRNAIVCVLIAIYGCTCDETPLTCPENPLVCLGATVTLYLQTASNTSQQAPAGTDVAEPPAVRVTDAGGAGVSGCTIVFAVTAGGGSLPTTTPLWYTNANGVARAEAWKLGNIPGLNRVTASATLCSSLALANIVTRSNTFEANGVPLTPQALVKAAGDGQNAAAGDTTRIRLRVRLTGQQGLGVAHQRITFRVISGTGTIGGAPIAAVDTDADGYAECPAWRLGVRPGAEVVEASFGTLAPVQFTVNATAGPPHTVVAGSVPRGAPGGAASPVPEVLVTDANGNNVPNASVRFEVLAGNGTVAGGAQAMTTTDANGKARPINWIFGMTAGQNRLRASVLRNNQLDATVIGNPVMFDVTTASTGTIVVCVTIYSAGRGNVAVTLTGAESRSGVTIADGTATFQNLTPGQYTVTITPPSGTYFPVTSETVTVGASETVAVEFDGHGASAGRSR